MQFGITTTFGAFGG